MGGGGAWSILRRRSSSSRSWEQCASACLRGGDGRQPRDFQGRAPRGSAPERLPSIGQGDCANGEPPGSAAAVGAARRLAAPELEAELVDLVLHGAGGGEGLEVLGGAAHELGLELVDLRSKGGRAPENIVPKEAGEGRVQESWRTHLAALAALQRELYGGSLLAEDEIPEHGQRFANDLTGACVR